VSVESFTTVKIEVVFWALAPFILVSGYRVSEDPVAFIFTSLKTEAGRHTVSAQCW
jgi:hypothetical protein